MSTPNIFSIERSTGVVTASENPLLVYNDVVPISVAFTDSGVVSTTLIPFRAALAVNLRLGTASGMMLAQAVQFDTTSGYSAAILKLPPEVQDRLYLSDGVVWLEFVLSEKTGPSSRHTVESLIDLAASGAPVDLDNPALTGNGTFEKLSPIITALGTVADGETATMPSATMDASVTFSGATADIALPLAPVNGMHRLYVTTTANVPIVVGVPSLRRIDANGAATVTSFTLPSAAEADGEAIVAFFANGGAWKWFTVSGDDAEIPIAAIQGVQNTPGATPSSSEIPTTNFVAGTISAALDGLEIDADKVVGTTPGKLLVVDTDGNVTEAALGANLSYNPTTKTISGAGSGTATPVALVGTDLDWNAGLNRTATISSNAAFTMSNIIDGAELKLLLGATGATRTPTWPANVNWGDQTAPAIEAGKNVRIRFEAFGTAIAASYRNGYTFDLTGPSYVSTAIATDGNTFTDTYDEALHATIATTTGRAMTVAGASITGTSPVVSGSTVVWTASPRITSGTVTANAYTAPGAGIKDLAGNFAATYSGRQADVTNGSTYSTYLFAQDTEGGSGSNQSGASATGTVVWNKATAGFFSTAGTYCWEFDGALTVDVGSAKNALAFFFHFRAQENNASWIYLRNGAGVDQATIEFRSDRINVYHGGVLSAKVTATTPNAEGILWGVYTANTGGNNGTVSLYYRDNSSDETRPGELGSTLTTGAGGAIQRIVFATPVAGNYYVGKLRLADSIIGSSPV